MPRKAKAKNGSKAVTPKPKAKAEAPATVLPPAVEKHFLTATEQQEMKPLEDELLRLKLQMANLRISFLEQERELEKSIATASQAYLDRTTLMVRNHGLEGTWSMNQTTYELTRAR